MLPAEVAALLLLLPAPGRRWGMRGEIPCWELNSPMQLEAKPVAREKKKTTKGLYNLEIHVLVRFSERLLGSRALEPASLKGYGENVGKITAEEGSWASCSPSLPKQST